MLINRRAKCDAASFILGGEIRNCTNTQNYKQTNTSVFGGRPYIHTCRGQVLPIDASPLHDCERAVRRGLASIGNTCCRAPIRRILGFCGAKFPKMGDSMPRTPMNHSAKFDAASFIPCREMCNRTNLQNDKITNKQ